MGHVDPSHLQPLHVPDPQLRARVLAKDFNLRRFLFNINLRFRASSSTFRYRLRAVQAHHRYNLLLHITNRFNHRGVHNLELALVNDDLLNGTRLQRIFGRNYHGIISAASSVLISSRIPTLRSIPDDASVHFGSLYVRFEGAEASWSGVAFFCDLFRTHF